MEKNKDKKLAKFNQLKKNKKPRTQTQKNQEK